MRQGFNILCLILIIVTNLMASYDNIDDVYCVLGNINSERGLQQVEYIDGPTIVTNIDGKECRKAQNWYIYFNVDDTYIYNGNYDTVEITIVYYDTGSGITNFLRIEYDSKNSFNWVDGAYWRSQVIPSSSTAGWKTNRIILKDVRFANRENGGSDFRIASPLDQPGFCIHKVTLRRIDRPDPIKRIDYTLWSELGEINRYYGVYQVEFPGDGKTVPAEIGELKCRKAIDNYIYFNVDDNFIYNGSQDKIFVAIKYYDTGNTRIELQYDSYNGAYRNAIDDDSSQYLETEGTMRWRQFAFYLPRPRFINSQNGGADFRLYCPYGTMIINKVWVTYLPGKYRGANIDFSSASSFSLYDKLFIVSNFFCWWNLGADPNWVEINTYPPYFDCYGEHPPDFDPDNTLRGMGSPYVKDWWKKQLLDLKDAGIDVFLPNFCGMSHDVFYAVALKTMVDTFEDMEKEGYTDLPKVGMFMETYFLGEKIIKEADMPVDFTTYTGKAFLYTIIRRFWSMIPQKYWAMVDDKPLIFLYIPIGVSDVNVDTFKWIGKEFQKEFGKKPYIHLDWSMLWSQLGDINFYEDENVVLEKWKWGLGQISPPDFSYHTLSIGPGYNESRIPGRMLGVIRDRMSGEWYRVGLTDSYERDGMIDSVLRYWFKDGYYKSSGATLDSQRHKITIVTWNEEPEGSGIEHTLEYGRKYIELNAFFKRMALKDAYKFSDDFSSDRWGDLTSTEVFRGIGICSSPVSKIEPDKSVLIYVNITNRSQFGWINYSYDKKGVVVLRAKDSGGVDCGNTVIPYPMAPGDVLKVPLLIHPTNSSGNLNLEFDLDIYGWGDMYDLNPGGNQQLIKTFSITSNITSPTSPTGVTATREGNTIKLDWNSSFNGDNEIDGYKIYAKSEDIIYFSDDFQNHTVRTQPIYNWKIYRDEWTVDYEQSVSPYFYPDELLAGIPQNNNIVLWGISRGGCDIGEGVVPLGVFSGDTNWKDYVLTLKVKIKHFGDDWRDGIWIGFRYKDIRNNYSLHIYKNHLYLHKCSGGISTSETTALAHKEIDLQTHDWLPIYGGWRTIKIRVEGNNIKIWFDGELFCDVTDNNLNGTSPVLCGGVMLSVRKYSFSGHFTQALFDDIKVFPLNYNNQWFCIGYTSKNVTSFYHRGVVDNKSYSYYVKAIDLGGVESSSSAIANVKVVTNQITSYFTEKEVSLNKNSFLKGDRVKISLNSLSGNEAINVKIYNLNGVLIKDIGPFYMNLDNDIEWDGKDNNGKYVLSGIYIIVINNGKERKVLKVAFVR